MENNENLGKLEEELINKLEFIRDGYIKLKEENSFSIRKDIVAACLKDIVANSKSLEDTNKQLNELITTLLRPEDYVLKDK